MASMAKQAMDRSDQVAQRPAQRGNTRTALLHGTLFVAIHEARSLPGDPTRVSCCPGFVNNVIVVGEKVATSNTKPPHPYCVMAVGGVRSAYTSVAARSFEPRWDELFRVPVASHAASVQFTVKEADALGSPHLGTATIPVSELLSGEVVSGWRGLQHKTGRGVSFGKAGIRVTVQYVPVTKSLGDMDGDNNWDCKHAFFRPRSGGIVTLYIDSHVEPNTTPVVRLPGGETFSQSSLWTDLYSAIREAKHIIYIAGWSVWAHNMLVRRQDAPMEEDEDHLELGTLLKRKADEGVRVNVLVWNDATSVRLGRLHTAGMLATHDEETATYFQNTKVNVHLSMRNGEAEKNILRKEGSLINFTHHQKLILVDVADTKAPGPDTNTAVDTEEGREQKAAPGGAADSGAGGAGGGIGAGAQPMGTGDKPFTRHPCSQRGAADDAAPSYTAEQNTVDTGVPGSTSAAAATGAATAVHSQVEERDGAGHTPRLASKTDGKVQDPPQDQSGGISEKLDGSATDGQQRLNDHNQHRSEGQLGSRLDRVGDTSPGTGHAAGHGAPTGPTRGRGQRRLVAFLGGIDICSGRYDTRDHTLFRTLHTTHSQDFYSNCIPGADMKSGGPRQPWHDTHTRIEGPAAFDVLTNFEDRWRHQTSSAPGEALLDFRKAGPPGFALPRNFDEPEDERVMVVKPTDPQAWRTQIFRSIDSECTMGLAGAAADNAEAFERGLVTTRGMTVDKSVQHAYIHAIRKAERFIYLENQYFQGGSAEWGSRTKREICPNLVPTEIALKVAAKIRARQPFAAYIVIPFWSEGPPKSLSIQEVQHWSTTTMKMMYRIVGQAIEEVGDRDAKPTDFLNFFMLANREKRLPNEPHPEKQPKKGSPAAKAQRMRRSPVYVHSKTLIIDDEFLIVGSANINERSMAGTRDSEICVGAHQPNLKARHRGQVHGFRISLWDEHLGGIMDDFDSVYDEPGSPECVRRVRRIAEANWKTWLAPDIKELQGHLCPFPLSVTRNGRVSPRPGFSKFPDVGGKTFGSTLRVPFFLRRLAASTTYMVTT